MLGITFRLLTSTSFRTHAQHLKVYKRKRCQNIAIVKSKFFSEGMFLYRGFSLLQSEHPLFLHFPRLFFKTCFAKVEAF